MPFRPVLLLLLAFAIWPAAAIAALASQSIDFPAPGTQYSASQPFTLQATATSGLPVTYSVASGGGILSLQANVVTLGGSSGAVTIRASQAGDGSFAPAADAYATFSVVSGSPWVVVASGVEHQIALRADGSLWFWKEAAATDDPAAPAIRIGTGNDWKYIAAGGNWSTAIRNDGSLWRWNYTTTTPVRVGTATDWKMVANSQSASLAIKNNGTLWAWGSNSSGLLGIPGPDLTEPTQVGTFTDWKTVSCGFSHNAAIRQNGTLWTWGANPYGQLGNGTRDLSGIVGVPTQIGTDTNWSAVSLAAGSITLALRTDNSLWGWGDTSSGRLGIGTSPPLTVNSPRQIGTDKNWRWVTTGGQHCLAGRTDGSLWAWGFNGAGQVGISETTNSILSPRQVGSARDWLTGSAGGNTSSAIRAGGMLWTWGRAQLQSTMTAPPAKVLLPSPVANFAPSLDFSMAVTTDGALWGWGNNGNGQLGDGTFTSRSVPTRAGTDSNWQVVRAGLNHCLALKRDGSLWAWGHNGNGQLGGGSSSEESPIRIGSDTTWKYICAGGSNSFGIKNDGSLWGWGRNASGTLGLGNINKITVPTRIGTATWKTYASGNLHSVGIRTDGSLWSTGSNTYGQLGNGTTVSNSLTHVRIGTANDWVAVASSDQHCLALKANGTLWAWGTNHGGFLGRVTPGDVKQNTPFQIGTDTDWVEVSASTDQSGIGIGHSLARKSNGTLWAWGTNNYGQLGSPDAPSATGPWQVGKGNAWSAIYTGTGCTASHSLAAARDGSLWAFGSNASGQLGTSNPPQDKTTPAPVLPFKGSQSITPIPVVVPRYGVPVAPPARATSGLPLTYFVTGPAVVSDGLLTVQGPGTVELLAWQAGDDTWFSAEPAVIPIIFVPGIALRSGSTELPAGAMLDFGRVLPDASSIRNITISNPGTAALEPVTVSLNGANAGDFTITTPPAISVPVGGSTTLAIRFSPQAGGERQANLKVISNTAAYEVQLQGYQLEPPRVLAAELPLNLLEDQSSATLDLATVFEDPEDAFADLSLAVIANSSPALIPAPAISGAGVLSLSPVPDGNGAAEIRLRATDRDGLSAEALVRVSVQAVNDAPLAAAIPDQTADRQANPISLGIAAFFSDVDLSREGDRLEYSLVANSNPALFSAVELDENSGAMVLRIAPYRSGEATLEVRATDLGGLSAGASFRVEVADLPPPELTLVGGVVLNRQTGLFEQRITILNGGVRDLGGFQLQVSGLPKDVTLQNASGPGGGISYLTPLPVGQSLTLTLEFLSASRQANFTPVVTASPALPEPAPEAAAGGEAILRSDLLEDGFLLEFTAVPGARYQVLYSPDNARWLVSPVTILAGANRVQWIDRGPPKTESKPGSGSRFYRVQRIADPE